MLEDGQYRDFARVGNLKKIAKEILPQVLLSSDVVGYRDQNTCTTTARGKRSNSSSDVSSSNATERRRKKVMTRRLNKEEKLAKEREVANNIKDVSILHLYM